jgi:hypothetical protein
MLMVETPTAEAEKQFQSRYEANSQINELKVFLDQNARNLYSQLLILVWKQPCTKLTKSECTLK